MSIIMKRFIVSAVLTLGLAICTPIVMANQNQTATTAKNQQFDQRYAQWKTTQPTPKTNVSAKSDKNVVKTSNGSSSKVNLNTATVTELQQLSGVGEAKAKAIIAYRKKQGGFKNIEELKQVKGIGDALFQKNKARLAL